MEVERMKVAELKSMLAERGLEESGKKAELVERLKEAMMTSDHQDDNLKTEFNSKEGSANGNGKEEGSDEESEESEDEEASYEREEVPSSKEAGEGPLNDDKDLKSIGSQEFVTKKPETVSFGLHTPKIKRPQLNLPVPPVEATAEVHMLLKKFVKKSAVPLQYYDTHTITNEQETTLSSSRRPGAAAFFGDGSGGNTTVPLPPSAGYSLEESDGEEEEPPPGTEPLGVMQVGCLKKKNYFTG